MTRRETDWEGVRLHVVTGKGGTGKTTVAAALALALAADGQTVLLCEVEGRQGISRLFDAPSLAYSERRIATVRGNGQSAGTHDPAGRGATRPDHRRGTGRPGHPARSDLSDVAGEVYGLAIDPEAALAEYLELYYHMGRAARALDKVGAIDFATTIAPGVRDVLLTGKVYEAVRRKDKQRPSGGRPPDTRKAPRDRPTYDTVVLDAPPTGRIARFLGVTAGVADIARVGPIRRQADAIMAMMRSPQTAVHIVTLLEEMPVQETADGLAELREAQIPVGGIVVNLAARSPLDAQMRKAVAAGKLARAEFVDALTAAGLAADDGIVDGLLSDAAEHATRVALEDTLRARITELGRPTYELPRLSDGIDIGGLFELARELSTQGMA
ncbi:ArsA-related P-loop ATPase [Actinopolymorpha sp. B9G3]|uniref:ArsA-related P-loop ATPase n=1 Tax=Actinopolymorpha sp. B9G3 TaxID=3158970 RepID=UPI0032D91BA7